jgi:hypothetical protein
MDRKQAAEIHRQPMEAARALDGASEAISALDAAVGDAVERCCELALPIHAEALAARIQVLVVSGRLEGQGDLRKWRHSEVRAK